MRNCILTILILTTLSTFSTGQNLVPNPSFEDTINCPYSGQLSNVADWYSPTTGSPDLYHECANRVPVNGVGHQYAKAGKCYTGIYTFGNHPLANPNIREYLQVQLTNSLNLGVQYCISFYVSLSDSSRYATDNFGALLTANPFSVNNFYVLPYSPQVNNPTGSLLQNKNSWVKISGTYLATGGEQFLTIGNFSNDINTDTLFVGPPDNSLIYWFAYYYVDALSIVPSNLQVSAGNDTTIVIGDSIYIGEQISNFNCNWYDSNGNQIAENVSGIYVYPSQSTYYVVEQNLCGIITYDTINITVQFAGINENHFENDTKLYPNPFSHFSVLEFANSNQENYSLIFLDFSGKVVRIINDISVDKIEIERQNLNTGLYYFQLILDSQIISKGKFIIE